MSSRKLATIEKVLELKPIKDADSIEVAIIRGWEVVVKKGSVTVGSKVVYFEIDSFLPDIPQFSFLSKTLKIRDGKRGYPLKTIRLRGQISQGLCLPASDFQLDNLPIETDVTETLGVLHNEYLTSTTTSVPTKNAFPTWLIPKTDEERIQNLKNWLDTWRIFTFYVTEKLDGCSCTMYIGDQQETNALQGDQQETNALHGDLQEANALQGDLKICSRNLIVDEDDSHYWKIGKTINKTAFPKDWAVQGEICGPKIQKNSYKLDNYQFFVFGVYNIVEKRYGTLDEMKKIAALLNLSTVPILSECRLLENNTVASLVSEADGKSVLCPTTTREGLVFRRIAGGPSKVGFKCISNEFLLKN